MILPKFELLEPTTIRSACTALQNGESTKVLAGGTDLLVNMKKKLATADVLVSLEKIPRLQSNVYSSRKGLTLGSMVTIAEVAESSSVKTNFPVLAVAAGKLGSLQVRNRATIGGNICTARPSGDTVGPLIAYDATVQVTGVKGSREEPVQNFILGPGRTTLGKDEILSAITIKTPVKNTGGSYAKYGVRNAMEIAIVSVTCLVTIQNGACRSARIVLGAVAPTFIRCPEAEQFLVGKEISENVVEKAAQLSADVSTPNTSRRGTSEYRRTLVNVLVKRGLLEAAANASNASSGERS